MVSRVPARAIATKNAYPDTTVFVVGPIKQAHGSAARWLVKRLFNTRGVSGDEGGMASSHIATRLPGMHYANTQLSGI